MIRISLIIILISLFSINTFAQKKVPDPNLLDENNREKVPAAPVLDWPFERQTGFNNYAQELIFNPQRGEYYLEKARAYYYAGYQGIQTFLGDEDFGYFKKITGIKWYEEDQSQADPYLRDPYKVERMTGSSPSIFQDFLDAQWYFTKAAEIIYDYIAWDKEISTKPAYKDLVNNTYKCLVYCNVYTGNYPKALEYLDQYKKFAVNDQMFLIEWEARIYGILVEVARKYDWAFVGNKSYEYLKKKHKELLAKAIEFHYSGESKNKDELKDRIYPELIYRAKIQQELEEEQMKDNPQTTGQDTTKPAGNTPAAGTTTK